MAKSSPCLSSFATALAGSVLVACSVAAEVRLNVLTECDDIARLDKAMRSASALVGTRCRPPKGPLERVIYKRAGGRESKLCFHESAVVPFLEGYSCMHGPMKTGASINCFRAANSREIERFKREFLGSAAVAANDYKIAASKCSVTNGNATNAPPTMLSGYLALVAKVEFGFISPLGTGRKTDSYVQHGFASVDPSIEGRPPSAIEFVSVLIAPPDYVSAGQKRNLGEWIVTLDADKETDEVLNSFYRRNEVPAHVFGRMYAIQSTAGQVSSRGEKEALLESLQRRLVRTLAVEGFDDLTDRAFERRIGRTRGEFSQALVEGLPFGRRRPGSFGAAGVARILTNESRPTCTNDEGMIMVVLLPIRPLEDVGSDFGSLLVGIAGLGSCSRLSLPSTKTYLEEVAELTDRHIERELTKR